MLRKVCRCSELVHRAVVMLSVASSSAPRENTPKSTTSRHEDCDTSRQCLDRPQSDASVNAASLQLDVSTTSRQEDCNTSRQCLDIPQSDASVNTASLQSDANSMARSLRLDLSSLSDPPTQSSSPPTPSQVNGPPTDTSAVLLLSAGARESSQQSVQLVSQATHDLCHVIQKHLSSQGDVTSSVALKSGGRRMLPVVPGTSVLLGSVLGLSTSAANVMRCHSARAAERSLSRHISMMCVPLKQPSSEA